MNAEALRPMLGRLLIFVLIVIAIATVFGLLSPAYVSQRNILAMFRQMSVTGIVAVGLTFVIVLRRFDLSLAGIASLSAMSLGFALQQTGNLAVSVATCIGVGLLCGTVSGVLIGKLRLPDVVTTIAIGSIAFGLAFFYNGGANFTSNFFSTGILDINDGKFLLIPFPALIMLCISILASVVLHMSRYGQAFYAIGENPVSARLSGISVKAYVGAGFAICGALVGLAMVLNVAALGAAYVNTGNRVLLPSYTAVYLGAAFFGSPTIPATLAGTLLMAMLLNGFTILSVPYYYSDAIISSILIIAIAIFSPQTLIFLRQAGNLFSRAPRSTPEGHT